MAENKKDVRLFIRATSDLVDRLELAAKLKFEGNVSLLAREAIREKLARMSRTHPELKEEEVEAAA